jgi:tRNA pseudouridine32 synthase/23S rRNA pseudouridine746 synthase
VSPLRIIHESRSYVVVDKPSGLLSVPGKGAHKADCVISRVREMIPRARGPLIVHRLDMDTSGLLVVGLTPEAQATLSFQFECRTVSKRYVALVEGTPPQPRGTVDLPMRLDIERRPYQIVDFIHGRDARTHYRLLSTAPSHVGSHDHTTCSKIEFEPVTGRAHQIRVHAATPPNAFPQAPPAQRGGLGCPILGDILYGDESASGRLMLHASMLSFNDPDTNNRVTFDNPAPF